MASIRAWAASSRAAGVSGMALGQEALTTSVALAAAALNALLYLEEAR